MSLSAFDNKAVTPNDEMVAEALNEKNVLWCRLKEHMSLTYKGLNEEWKFYSKAAGWTLSVRSGKRTLFYLIPMNGHFKIGFVFGSKAVEEAMNAGIPENIVRIITEATQYVEGKSFMMDVNNGDDVGTAIELIDIKNRN